ncbi:signal transduction histidine kinase [Streptomyces sp. SAI-117]|uniref:sensor histidine kinase n=1 Tax=unclassified Streptomyces TaxID=2593676 RepID=UPI002472E857|nr:MULTISPECIES: histidine kinase [unclassified Streptomyces]MDH6553817.1 signal transduction histidine kinase [Streptomyces sp. SAI-041]MDH6572895.1 signal transduction histidine kinase [Streptomyces sp. SAI-117]MDH6582143.1 signal transduction histidine kinase [Streptomyces sp. SAI-133]
MRSYGARAASVLRATGMPPRRSRWTWIADVLLAAVLAVGTLSADLDRSAHDDRPRAPRVTASAPASPSASDPAAAAPTRPVPPREQDSAPAQQSDPRLPPAEPWELALAVLSAAPLALRRRCPLAAFWAVLVATWLFHLGEITTDAAVFAFASALIAAYSAAMYSPHRVAALVSLVLGGGAFCALSLLPEIDRGLIPLLVLLPVALGANLVHAWQQRVRAQQDATRLAVERERSRIARELHDVVTHNVSMMTIQASAARKTLDASPDLAREALQAVEAGGRAALAELRHVMGLLTMASDGPDPAATADLAPQPGLGQLAELTGRVRSTGVPVELSVTGTPVPLPAGVDLAAYRVVQEALTNAVKHAAGAAVTVSVEHAPGEVRVAVEDTGGQRRPRVAGSGRGLIGLRERLALYGGTLSAGSRPHGGFAVLAIIPVEAE